MSGKLLLSRHNEKRACPTNPVLAANMAGRYAYFMSEKISQQHPGFGVAGNLLPIENK